MAANLLCYSAAGKWAKPPWLKCLAKINASYITFDDVDYQNLVRQSPKNLLNFCDKSKLNILDEVQKAPELLPAVKIAVDRDPGRYRFVLSGSANLLVMKQVSESLAGRAVYFILDPMTVGEINQSSQPDLLRNALDGNWLDERELPADLPDADRFLLRGLMPAGSIPEGVVTLAAICLAFWAIERREGRFWLVSSPNERTLAPWRRACRGERPDYACGQMATARAWILGSVFRPIGLA